MISGFVDRFFGVTRQQSTIRTEVIAGVTTFLTMAYIMFVNPSILAAAGMDEGAVFVATCVAAIIGTLIMGIFANYPVALAPGMGLNAYFAYTVVGSMGYSWQTALFDTTGTLVGLAERSGMLDEQGRLPRSNRALLADSTATVVGAVMGTSTTTSYIESGAGINAGGRTGLVAVTVAMLFVLSLFFAPLAISIPAYATAPALLLVACMMMGGITRVTWSDVTEYVPAVITVLFMPLTFSIANGIGAGFIAYAAIKLLAGRWRDVHISVIVVAILAAIKFAFFA